jgi:nitroimidazol reductase NimA-like FMN-containing flavoprotein (pyridoxamine 5'-phosphate oxidase superfamily)
MLSWAQFATEEPRIAQYAQERFAATGLCLVATIRRNGHPRVSPVEPLLHGGELYLGMMWRSRKAQDLLRDPRCAVNSIVSDREGTEGEVKLYGRAREVNDADEREAYCQALNEAIGWRPENDEFHLFALQIAEAAYLRFGEEGQTTLRYSASC